MSVELELIEDPDTGEVVRDQIAAILVTEIAKQKALAVLAAKDPRLWDFQVFVERTNAFGKFEAAQGDRKDVIPIVSVKRRRETTDPSKSDVVKTQHVIGVFEIDCYGYATSKDDGAGHDPADRRANFETQRVVKLVKKILMSDGQTYLGLRKIVGYRMWRDVDFFDPEDLEQVTVQKVSASRINLEVHYQDISPQAKGVDLEVLFAEVKHTTTGEVLLQVEYDLIPPP